MLDSKKIEQIARQIHESLPKSIREFGDDVEKKIRLVLQTQLTKLDLVNRDEFDVQTQVLLRTREKLNQLEQRLSALEGQPGEKICCNKEGHAKHSGKCKSKHSTSHSDEHPDENQ